MMAGPSSRSSRITGRIRDWCPAERALTRSGEPVKRKMTMTPEPKDKLDATTIVGVNGPEDEVLDWDAVDWRACEKRVRRLRQRIFTASRAGDLKKVRNLQKLMLRSRANTLVECAAGDGAQRWSHDGGRGRRGGAHPRRPRWIWSTGCSTAPSRSRPCPVRRVYIPKQGSSEAAPARYSRDSRPRAIRHGS